MTTYHVPEMHCEHCVKRISDALSELSMDFTVSLKNRTVTTNGDPDKVVSALDDLGFSAKKVQ